MPSAADLDAMPREQARKLLSACCGASRWVEEMVARRPFRGERALLASAEEVWWGLGESDWKEAFTHHPRIGERGNGWSEAEQSGLRAAAEPVRLAFAAVNREYEARFGGIYIVCASGRSGDELLAVARARLGNDPETELRIAGGEQLKITLLRLHKLLREDG